VAETGEIETATVGCVIVLFGVFPLHAAIATIKRMVRAEAADLAENKIILLHERIGEHSNNHLLDVKGLREYIA
jgi:hypothetical protein